MRLSALAALVFLSVGFSSPVGALEIIVTPVVGNNGKFLIELNKIDPIDDRVYTIRSDSGLAVIKFSDGIPGAIPPSGHGNVVATYRYGVGGVDGSIISIYSVVQNLLPVSIPYSDFIGPNNQEDVSFSLIGLARIKFEFSREEMLVIESQPRAVPEAATLLLMSLGLAGIGLQRRRRLNA